MSVKKSLLVLTTLALALGAGACSKKRSKPGARVGSGAGISENAVLNKSDTSTDPEDETHADDQKKPAALTYPLVDATYVRGLEISPNKPTLQNADGVRYSVDRALPEGLSLDAATGEIKGIPTKVHEKTSYKITAKNSMGEASILITITVQDPPQNDDPSDGGTDNTTGDVVSEMKIAYENPSYVFEIGKAPDPITPTVEGDIAISFTIDPALPAGLLFDEATGTIDGSPSVPLQATVFTITALKGDKKAETRLTIEVRDNTPLPPSNNDPRVLELQMNGQPLPTELRFELGKAILAIAPKETIEGLTYAVDPELPQGLNLDKNTGVIEGIPSKVSEKTGYTIVGTGSDKKFVANIMLTVFEAPKPEEMAPIKKEKPKKNSKTGSNKKSGKSSNPSTATGNSPKQASPGGNPSGKVTHETAGDQGGLESQDMKPQFVDFDPTIKDLITINSMVLAQGQQFKLILDSVILQVMQSEYYPDSALKVYFQKVERGTTSLGEWQSNSSTSLSTAKTTKAIVNTQAVTSNLSNTSSVRLNIQPSTGKKVSVNLPLFGDFVFTRDKNLSVDQNKQILLLSEKHFVDKNQSLKLARSFFKDSPLQPTTELQLIAADKTIVGFPQAVDYASDGRSGSITVNKNKFEDQICSANTGRSETWRIVFLTSSQFGVQVGSYKTNVKLLTWYTEANEAKITCDPS